MAKHLVNTINALPPLDQAAFRLLCSAVPTGALADDPHETVRRCYALADAYLAVARENWKRERAKKKGPGGIGDAAATENEEP